jgi:predicted PurR-regulated permease PerM
MGIIADKRLQSVWKIAVLATVVFGVYFLRAYISVILVAAIAAFIFNPIYQWFLRRFKTPRQGASASLTFIVSLVAIIIPIGLIVFVTFLQVKHLIDILASNPDVDLKNGGQGLLDTINKLGAHIPGSPQITMADLEEGVRKLLSNGANALLDILTASVGGISRFITSLIIYIYLFVNMLMYQDQLINTIKRLNPLGKQMSDTYQAQIGAMTKAMVLGQFIIAVLQGTESAVVLYIAGFHTLFLFFVMFLSFMSLIPLGAGIVTIPVGIVLILTGNVWQGVLIIANHLLIVTNIDNVIRPKLVPKKAHLNSALTILGVFAGLGMFGFLGIIVGPVIMIIFVTTIQSYTKIVPTTKETLKN